MIFQTLKHGTYAHLKADRLLVQEVKQRLIPDHGGHGILQGLGGLDAAMVDEIQTISVG